MQSTSPKWLWFPVLLKFSIGPIINIKNLYEGPFRLTWKNGGSYTWVLLLANLRTSLCDLLDWKTLAMSPTEVRFECKQAKRKQNASKTSKGSFQFTLLKTKIFDCQGRGQSEHVFNYGLVGDWGERASFLYKIWTLLRKSCLDIHVKTGELQNSRITELQTLQN